MNLTIVNECGPQPHELHIYVHVKRLCNKKKMNMIENNSILEKHDRNMHFARQTKYEDKKIYN